MKAVRKDTNIFNKRSLRIGGDIREFNRGITMGIVNLTPDSFYSESRVKGIDDLLKRVASMVEDGADIIDIGAYSSRPGAEDIPEETELARLLPCLAEVRKTFPGIILSVDTFRSQVAAKAAGCGADMINDISGGLLDENMFGLVAGLRLPYILMHMKGNPRTMMQNTYSPGIVGEVYRYFSERLALARNAGMHDVILDPGFGFGKSLEDNYRLLHSLSEFTAFGTMILCGLSRKSMAGKVTGKDPSDSLSGTIALNTIALLNGAGILRVHDVKAARDAVSIVSYYQNV